MGLGGTFPVQNRQLRTLGKTFPTYRKGVEIYSYTHRNLPTTDWSEYDAKLITVSFTYSSVPSVESRHTKSVVDESGHKPR
jgi:hypothetical protein